MRARIFGGGEPKDVRGRSVASIARTHFGRHVSVKQGEVRDFDPKLVEWTVVEPVGTEGREWNIIGRIIEYRRGPGRPPTHPVARTEKVLLRLTPAEKRQLASMARQSGRSVNDEIINRCGLGEQP